VRHIGILLLLEIVYTINRKHRLAGCRGVAYVTGTYVLPLDEQREALSHIHGKHGTLRLNQPCRS